MLNWRVQIQFQLLDETGKFFTKQNAADGTVAFVDISYSSGHWKLSDGVSRIKAIPEMEKQKNDPWYDEGTEILMWL